MGKFKRFVSKVVSMVLILGTLVASLSGALLVNAEETANVLTTKYYAGSEWENFSKQASVSGITALRLTTSSSAGYYLQYRTFNNGASSFYSYVRSDDTASNAYAGTAESETNQRAIQLVQIRVLNKADDTPIRSNIIVMYRVKVDGAWLDWVSNADPEWMQSVKSKYNLSGNLDPTGSYAGRSGSNIEGIEIRLFEEGDLPDYDTFSGNEISSNLSYKSNGGTYWIGFNKKTETGEIDRIRINTTESDFYLTYQTKNQGVAGFYSEVSSNDSSVYAGMENKPIQLLRIKAYTKNGAKLNAGVVVMYRVKISTGWLNWVSNADPEYMRSVHSQYSLGGGLDVNSSYAGKDGYNILGVEIRIFKGDISGYEISNLSGKEAKPAMSFATNTSTFTSFDKQTPVQTSGGMISGLKIQTSANKDYFLSYSVQAKDKGGYYTAVNSTTVNDYAGIIGNPIQALKIKVYNKSGTATLSKGVVVMYRAYIAEKGWLPWVSNADPEWMQSVKIKYGIEGALDTSSGYAGVIGNNILAVEIRVFEEKEIITTCGSKNAKLVSAPYINQMNNYPTGCESASTVMALQKAGVNITMKTFVDKYLPKVNDTRTFNPNEHFGGDPTSRTGMGCYAPAIIKALEKALAGKKQYGLNITGSSLSYLCSNYIDNGIPVIMWATVEMQKSRTVKYNNVLTWISPEHCLLLVGYDNSCYIFHDPMKGANVHYMKSDVETPYSALGKQAIVILTGSTPSTPATPENTNPSTTPASTPKEYVKPNTVDKSNCADPVDLSTGSHILENQLITLFGGNKTSVSINYNSSQLVSGSLGTGWYHNFEKRLEVLTESIKIYDSPSVYSIYVKQTDTVYICTSKGRENYVLSVLDDGSYVLDCNKSSKMYFTTDGKLSAVEDKYGFVTNISYTENSIIISDAIKGTITFNITNGLISSVTDGIRTVVLGYSNGYLISIKDVNDSMLYYTYNDNGLIESGSDDNGTVYFVNHYDTEGRVIKQYDASDDDAFTLFNYSDTENGLLVTVTNRNGDISQRLFNEQGQIIGYTDENGNTTEYDYDSHLNLISVTDANGNSETTVYNDENMPIEYTDKNGNKTYYHYDTNNNLTSILYGRNGDVNEDGAINILDYVQLQKHLEDRTFVISELGGDINEDGQIDSADLLVLKKHVLGLSMYQIAIEIYKYNNRNQLISATDLEGVTTTYAYDDNAMPLSKTVANRTEQYTYTDGNLVELIDALGVKTVYSYNALYQVISKQKDITNIYYEFQYEPGTLLPPDSFEEDWGFEVEKTEKSAFITSYTYDNKGNVLIVTDDDGNTISRTYDGNSLLTSETDANGNTTYYSYNGNMKLLYVTFADGTYIYYDYDSEDRVIATVDQKGNVSNTQYDPAGRVILKSDAEKNTIEYVYDNVGNVIKTINSDGGVITSTYDNNGNAITVTDTLGNIVTNIYDRYNRIIKSTNALGGVTEYKYSLKGNLLQVIDPLGNTTKNTYDKYGNKLSVTDPNGNITTYTYDNNDNFITVTDALGNVTTNVYDEENRILKTEKPNGATVVYTYDAAGRLLSVRDALGNTQYYTYDSNGNVLTVKDGLGNIQTTNEYDGMNRLVISVNAGGGTVTNSYDANGNLTSVTDSSGNQQSYAYDRANRITTVTDKSGNKTSVEYYSNGKIKSVLLDGSSTVYTYDTNGNLLTETTSSGGLVSYTYNSLNLKNEVTNAKGQVRAYSYDALGRITGYTSPEGNASYTYDANGNVLTATDQNGTVERTFDALNRVTSYTDTQGKTISYEYDSVGMLTKLTYPDGTAVYYAYDLNGNLVRVTDWANRTTHYYYDDNNNLTLVIKPDGSRTETQYDNAQRVTYTATTKNSTIIVGFEYVYDTEGRIILETDLAKNIKSEYTYDELSRVTSRKITNLTDNTETLETYTYDANGNILSSTVSTESDTFVYDDNNRLVEYNGQAVTYDADGNMLSANGLVLTYDSANRLISAGNNSYTYDIENTRIKNLCNGVETVYTYNTNVELSQLLVKTTGDTVTKYVYGVGLIGEETNGNFKTYHFDYRGSTVAITDSTGTVTDTFTYDSYGNLINRTGTSDVIFLYNGEYGVVTDDNGLLYMRARYYSPELRRFVNADILMGDINNSSTLNRYAYANGNPVSNIDPFGLEAILDEYINSNFSGIKNISLVINSPNINSREVANIENGKLNNGHSFIRLDDGNGNVRYVGFSPVSIEISDMILGKNVAGKFVDDSNSDWDVAKVYKLSDEQYSYISKYINSLNFYNWNYNIETYNCTTFAVNTVKLMGAAAGNFMTVREHDWVLPTDMAEQLDSYNALPNWIPSKLAAWIIELTMGNFYGYTPADAAQDLLGAEGNVLIKQKDSIETITNTTYFRSK